MQFDMLPGLGRRMVRLTVIQSVEEWLQETEGYSPYIATETGADPITPEAIIGLAKDSEWAEVDDNSNLSGAHPKGLIIGLVSLREYCASGGEAEGSEAHFLTAYRN